MRAAGRCWSGECAGLAWQGLAELEWHGCSRLQWRWEDWCGETLLCIACVPLEPSIEACGLNDAPRCPLRVLPCRRDVWGREEQPRRSVRPFFGR